jgi:7-cyano-7-deazaguanine reductase
MTMLGRPVEPDEVGRLDTFTVGLEVAHIEFAGAELQSLCPAVDGTQPDIYRWTIRFAPSGRSIESKSLKLYLTTFREERIFAEHLATKIARDVCDVVGVSVTVSLEQNVRGGIVTTVEAVAAAPQRERS